MYECRECRYQFEKPKKFIETHGLDTPPYEEWYGCPVCAGDYEEIQYCDVCGEPMIRGYSCEDDDRTVCYECAVTLGLLEEEE